MVPPLAPIAMECRMDKNIDNPSMDQDRYIDPKVGVALHFDVKCA